MTALPKHPVSTTVGWTLLQAARLHRARLEEKLAKWGLFAGQEQVIQVLASTDRIAMAELAAVVRVRPPTVSKIVARLVSQGLVERQSEPEDGRLVRVSLTDRGKQISAEIECLWKDVEAELLGPLDAQERQRLRKALRRVAKNLATLVGGNSEGLDEDLEDPPEATGLCA